MALNSMYDIIIRQINTEKSARELADGKYYFEVVKNAGKDSVKSAVEKIFGVEVLKINISNRKGKVKRFKGKIGQRNSIKIAVVSLKKGQTINFDKIG
jgi:large subunit ribosomal protein L23